MYSGRPGRAETAPTSSSPVSPPPHLTIVLIVSLLSALPLLSVLWQVGQSRDSPYIVVPCLTPTPSYHCPHCLPALCSPPPLCTLAGRAEQRQPLHRCPLSHPNPSYHCPHCLPALPLPLLSVLWQVGQGRDSPYIIVPCLTPPHLTIVLVVSLLSALPLLYVLWQVGQSRDSPYIILPSHPHPILPLSSLSPCSPPSPSSLYSGRSGRAETAPISSSPVSPHPILPLSSLSPCSPPSPSSLYSGRSGRAETALTSSSPVSPPSHLPIVLVLSLLSALPLLSVLWQVGQSRDSPYIVVPCLTPTLSYHCPYFLPALRPPPALCTLAGRAEQRQPLHHRPLSHPHPILPLSLLSPCSPPSPCSLYSGRSGRAETAPTLSSPVLPQPYLTIVLIFSLLSALPLLSVLWQVGQSRDSPYIIVLCLTPTQSYHCPYFLPAFALPLLSVLWQVGQSRDSPYIIVLCLTPTPSYHCPYFLPALRPPPALCTLAGRAEQRQPLHHGPLSHPHPILPLSLFSPCSPPSPCSLYSGRSGKAETAPTSSSSVSPPPHLTIVLIFSLLSTLPLLYVLWQVGQSRDSPYMVVPCLTPTTSYQCPHCLPALRPPPPPLCTLAGRAGQRQPLHHPPLSHPNPILPLSLFSPCSPPSPSSLYSGRSGRAETAPTSSSSVSPPPHLTIVLIFSLLYALPLLSVLWQVGQSRDSPYIVVPCLTPTPSYHCPHCLPALHPPPPAGRAEQRQPLHRRSLLNPNPILPLYSLFPCSPPYTSSLYSGRSGRAETAPTLSSPVLPQPYLTIVLIVSLLSALPLLSVLWQVGQSRDSPYIVVPCLTPTPSYHCPHCLPALRPPPPLCTLAGRAEQRQPLHRRP